jgi:hypothetical protein
MRQPAAAITFKSLVSGRKRKLARPNPVSGHKKYRNFWPIGPKEPVSSKFGFAAKTKK